MSNSPLGGWSWRIPLPRVNYEILELPEELIADGAASRKAALDAAHVAIASVCGCEYLLTWNCRHLAHAQLDRAIRRVIERHGYDMPICVRQKNLWEEKSCDVEG